MAMECGEGQGRCVLNSECCDGYYGGDIIL